MNLDQPSAYQVASRTLIPTTDLKQAICRVCSCDGKQTHVQVREMMYGSREVFEYFQCGICGCLQIGAIPTDMSRYYRSDYYSFNVDQSEPYRHPVKNFLNRLRDRITLFAPYGDHFPLKVGVPHLASSFSALRRVPNLSLRTRFLDVGCGSGQLLHRLANVGFQHLTGIDPFITDTRQVNHQLRIIKGELSSLDGEYDLILLNHSFEHLSDPLSAAKQLAALLASDGMILLRIPVVDSVAWKLYGPNWFQLDAPRHLYLHSKESVRFLAAHAGLQVVEIHHDSDYHQFQMSERFCADVPTILSQQERINVRPPTASRAEIRGWKQLSASLNELSLGDQACFYLGR